MGERTSQRGVQRRWFQTIASIGATAVLAAATCVWSVGCSSSSMNISGRSVTSYSVSDATAYYDAGRYDQAFTAATEVYRSSSPTSRTREEAAYIAGLSAFQLGRHREASSYLRPLTDHEDDTIAGNASATMGLIAEEANRQEEAVLHFTRAYDLLHGPDRAEAAHHAAEIYQALGRTSQARKYFLLARAGTDDPGKREEIQSQIDTTGWTVQLGAFTNLNNALRRAREYDATAVANSVGPASVVEKRAPDGRMLYYVQVGSFFDHQLAERARLRIGGPSIVTQIDASSLPRYAGTDDDR